MTPQNELKLGPASEKDVKITGLLADLESLLITDKANWKSKLGGFSCRSIRIGSYKSLGKGIHDSGKDSVSEVLFTQKAFYLNVPYFTNSKRIITLVIPIEDILGIEFLNGRSMPLLFISAMPSACERIRKDLNLEEYKSHGLYYDLECNDDTMKKITMLPQKLSDDSKKLLSVFYAEIITELDNSGANELLVKSTPKAMALQAQQALQVINIYFIFH